MSAFERDLYIILNCFVLIGLPDFIRSKSFLQARTVAGRYLYKLWKNLMTIFGFYSVVMTYRYMPIDNLPTILIAMATNFLIITLRLTISFKRSKILRLLIRMNRFMNKSLKSYKPRKIHVLFICLSSIVLPFISHACYVYFLINNFDSYKDEFEKYLIEGPENRLLTMLFIVLFQTAFLFHFYLIPSLCMILLSYIYCVYGEMFEQTFMEITQELSEGFSAIKMRRSVLVLEELYQIYEEIESVLSPSTFNAYVLSLMNFFNVVSVTRFYQESESKELKVYCALVFAWALLWVVVLIITGSRLASADNLKNNFRRNTVLDFLQFKKHGKKSEFYLLMFLDCLRTNVFFTTWGFLKIDRELLLTTFGFIVTYSALIITL